MQILIIGSGGREHAWAWKLKQSPSLQALYAAPGNPGIAQCAECVELKDVEAIVGFCKTRRIDLVVIGPEQPLVDGLADHLRAADVAVIGPSQAAARLEGSKDFTKQLCRKYHIPTAGFATFDNAEEAQIYIDGQGAPIVVKADGLAAGKGVTVAMSKEEAWQAVDQCFAGSFGAAGSRVVIEDYLQGEEASFFALCDGETAIEIGSAQDHKRIGEGDTGPNTGGMGAYSPAPVMTPALRSRVMEEIILPTVHGMKADGVPYHGILFAGLMITPGGPKLIEYNCRFGDPEAQVVLPRVQGDLAALLYRATTQGLAGLSLALSEQSALCVVMASKGYPGAYEKGSVISGLEVAETIPGVIVYHAGTRRESADGPLTAQGGRVLGISALADTLVEAQAVAYRAVDAIDWPQGVCRRDIGWRALQ